MPELSVIIPSFNRFEKLIALVDKLESQNLSLEIILIDDGSDTKQPFIDLQSKYKNIIVILHSHTGQPNISREQGLKIATGKYICFLDNDDMITDDFQKCFEECKKVDYDIFQYKVKYIFLKSKIEKIYGEKKIYEENNISNIPKWNCLWNKFFKRSLLTDIKFFIGREENTIIALQAYEKARKVYSSDFLGYTHFVENNDSLWQKQKYDENSFNLRAKNKIFYKNNLKVSLDITKKFLESVINDIKFMSLGSNCANLGFIRNRIKGPVDNLSGCNNIICFEILFCEDTILDELKNEPIITNRVPNFEGDSDKYYFYKHYVVCHNNPLTEKYKIEFEKRLRTFQDFYKNINLENHYFVYSLGSTEINKSNHTIKNYNLIQAEIDFLKSKGILDKTIFVGCKNVSLKNNWDFYSDEFPIKFPDVNYILIEDLDIWHPEASQKQFEEKFLKLLEKKILTKSQD